MSDEDLIQKFITARGTTKCPPMPAHELDKVPIRRIPRHEPIFVDDRPDDLRRLARLKIAMAFVMLRQFGKGSALSFERREAEFFLTQSSELAAWCRDAGLNVELVRTKAREIMAQRKAYLSAHRYQKSSLLSSLGSITIARLKTNVQHELTHA